MLFPAKANSLCLSTPFMQSGTSLGTLHFFLFCLLFVLGLYSTVCFIGLVGFLLSNTSQLLLSQRHQEVVRCCAFTLEASHILLLLTSSVLARWYSLQSECVLFCCCQRASCSFRLIYLIHHLRLRCLNFPLTLSDLYSLILHKQVNSCTYSLNCMTCTLLNTALVP